MPRVFVIRPFGSKSDSNGNEIDFDLVEEKLIKPAIEKSRENYDLAETTKDRWEAGNIRAEMFQMIVGHDLAIADVSIHNANAFYELGIRHALRRQHTILIRAEISRDSIPFDIGPDRHLLYNKDDLNGEVEKLIKMIDATAESRRTSSPVFLLVPELQEVKSEQIILAPLSLMRQIEFAEQTKDKGMLRLLREEIRGLEYEYNALRRLSRAQQNTNDLDHAIKSLCDLPDSVDGDAERHLSLASLYNQLYHQQRLNDIDFITKSNQEVENALANENVTLNQKTAALFLKAQNLKSVWKMQILNDGETSVETVRARAAHDLRSVYDAFSDSYRNDFNNCLAALNTYVLGKLLLTYVDDSIEGLELLLLKHEEEPTVLRGHVSNTISTLSALIPSLLERSKNQENDNIDVSVNVVDSLRAQFALLQGEKLQAISQLYVRANETAGPEDWEWVKSELTLMRRLTLIDANSCNHIITSVENARRPHDQKTSRTNAILFAGHGIDKPDSIRSRFPESAEDRARECIEAALVELRSDAIDNDLKPVVIASGFHGADVLCHEICDSLKPPIPSILCLPIPPRHYEKDVFRNHPDWANRYLDIYYKRMEEKLVWVMNDDDKMPEWLSEGNETVWSRGSKWITKRFHAANYSRKTFLALWDNQDIEDNNGGTGHLVRLVREEDSIYEKIVDARTLLEEGRTTSVFLEAQTPE